MIIHYLAQTGHDDASCQLLLLFACRTYALRLRACNTPVAALSLTLV